MVPIYEYLCDGCAYQFEIKQGMKDDPIATCERCGKPVRRLISSPAIMFKGSGWYVTDYSDKMKPPAGAESGSPAAGEEKKEAAATPAGTTTAAPTPGTSSTPAAASTSTTATTPSTTASTPPTSSSTPSSSNK
jgi:putative FmdB family regulatory protein